MQAYTFRISGDLDPGLAILNTLNVDLPTDDLYIIPVDMQELLEVPKNQGPCF